MPSEKKDDDDESRASSPNKEITDVAAEAASLQPTGHTLATTQVCVLNNCIMDATSGILIELYF